MLDDRAVLTRLARDAEIDVERIPDLLRALHRWAGSPLDLVKRVELGSAEVALFVDLSRFVGDENAVLRHGIRTRMKRRGVEMRLVLHGSENARRSPDPDAALVKAVARTHGWFDSLLSGRVESLVDIAKAEGVSDRYVSQLLPLAFLAPDIVAAILEGAQPIELTAETLTKRCDLPLGWAEQRSRLGFGTRSADLGT